jgi:hypothetical protein
MSKLNEKALHAAPVALRDEELTAVSGARLYPVLGCFPKPYWGPVDNSKHVNQTIQVTGNTFSEKGPGDLNVSIGGQSVTA